MKAWPCAGHSPRDRRYEENELEVAEEKQNRSHDDALKAAMKEVGRAEVAHEKLVARQDRELARYGAAKARAEGSDQKRLANAVLAARQRVKDATKARREAWSKLREARKMLREQQQLSKELERRERARERAVTAFLRKWEREYDLEMQRKRKNITLRKRAVREG